MRLVRLVLELHTMPGKRDQDRVVLQLVVEEASRSQAR